MDINEIKEACYIEPHNIRNILGVSVSVCFSSKEGLHTERGVAYIYEDDLVDFKDLLEKAVNDAVSKIYSQVVEKPVVKEAAIKPENIYQDKE